MTISRQKKELRLKIRLATAALSRREMEAQAEEVFARLEGAECFRRASTVAFFWALSDEIPTQKAVERWTAGGKRILLPVVDTDAEGLMHFKEYVAGQPLAEGALRVLHPSAGEVVPCGEIDLVIVPGVAFDTKGRRLGRGKGYYDRFLKECGARRIGVCLKHQLCETVPCDDHDIAMDEVIAPE